MPSIKTLLEDARKRLVETGTRNRLIHVNRKAARGNFLNIINERSDNIFQILRLSGKKMKFAGKGEEEEPDADGIVLSEIPDQDFEEGRYTDSVLEAPLTPDALQKRLLKLSKDARTAEEEQGINILYLAMGFLQWYEDGKPNVLREAPLILLPVELVRNNKTSTYDIMCRDDDIVANLSLQERLKLDFAISLPEIDDSTDWFPSQYFNRVTETISGKDRWKIDPNGMQLGFFSFAKLMMLRDLDPDNWDEESLLVNKIISGLLSGGFQPDPPLFKEGDNLDDKLSPDQIFHVVDADSSQTKVIEEVRLGRNLVVQGPPGTGKSQTITNIIAAAVHDNKKVLFVAEKMAALEVVYNRMCKVGLEDLCLELHSRRASKKIFLQKLAETIHRSKGIETPSFDASELIKARDKLNKVTNLLHSPLSKRDYTPFEVLSKLVSFVSKKIRAPRFDATQLEAIGKEQERELFNSLDEYLEIVEQHGFGKDNPFFGATNLDLQPTDLQRLGDDLKDAIESLHQWADYQRNLEKELTPKPIFTLASANNCRSVYQKLKDAPESSQQYVSTVHENIKSARFIDALSNALNWTGYKARMADVVTESVWTNEIDHLRQPIVKGIDSFLYRIFGKYKSASKELSSYLKGDLPRSAEDRLKLLDGIVEGKSRKVLFDDETEFFKARLGEEWRGERTSFIEIEKVLYWLQDACKELVEFSSEKLRGLLEQESTKSFDSGDFDSKKSALLETIQKVQARLGLPELENDTIQTLSLVDLKNRMSQMVENTDSSYALWTRFQFAKNKILEYPCGEALGDDRSRKGVS